MNLAPIILFTYNRPSHTRRTVEALLNNVLADKSRLFVFSDGAKDEDEQRDVHRVRDYLRKVRGFLSIRLVERERNWGLADSIVSGVSEVIEQYGSAIVLEDDIVTSPYFLTFMNKALSFYRHEKRVWHISGWNYPIDPSGLPDAFLWRVMNCWGWATWADRWQHFEKDPGRLISTFSSADIYRFDVDGTQDFWSQVLANYDGKINTWAIFWYATIFERSGLCLNPVRTFVNNIGHDGSGVNCGRMKGYIDVLNNMPDVTLPAEIKENVRAVDAIKALTKRRRRSLLGKIQQIFLCRIC